MNFQVERIDPKRIPAYQNGAEGFFAFVEENIRFEVPQRNSQMSKWLYPPDLPDEPDPVTGKSFKDFWENQKEELRPGLEMKNGKLKYKIIVLCWPRGEGKSFLAVLLQLWKFFCFPRQLIVFGALSKDQTRFVHYDISQKVILNSPKLLNIIGKNNVQHGRLFLKDRKGEATSSIQPISSFSGIVSNITGYTFSEMFDMKDPKFFIQLDGSTRNIFNSLGTIDSTVSTKDHILYHLYESWLSGADQLLYFSHRSAPNATPDEFWHPHMDKKQIDAYRHRFPPAEFDRYFRNTWELDAGRLFTEPLVKSIFHIGYFDKKGEPRYDDGTVLQICDEIQECYAKMNKKDRRKNKGAKKRRRRSVEKDRARFQDKVAELESRLIPVDNLYSLSYHGLPAPASFEALQLLSEKYNTNWSIHAGIDRSDPMARTPSARTIVTTIAKGLTNSRDQRNILTEDRGVPSYIYFLLHLAHVSDATLEGIKQELKMVHDEYRGLDTVCSERWGAWDLAPWCEQHECKFEAIFPSYDIQKKAFSELYIIANHHRFKSPSILVPGTKKANILWEELTMFDHDPQKKWYGSPEKGKTNGVQDDAVYATALGIYGGREFGIDDFKERKATSFFGIYVPGNKKFAQYGESA